MTFVVNRNEFVTRTARSDHTAQNMISRSPQRQLLLPTIPRPPSGMAQPNSNLLLSKPQYSFRPTSVLETRVEHPIQERTQSPLRAKRLADAPPSLGQKPGPISFEYPSTMSEFQRQCSPTRPARTQLNNFATARLDQTKSRSSAKKPEQTGVDFTQRFDSLINEPDRSEDRFVKHRFNLAYKDEVAARKLLEETQSKSQSLTQRIDLTQSGDQSVLLVETCTTQCHDLEANIEVIRNKQPRKEEYLFPYEPLTDRQLVMAEPCDFELDQEANIPYSGSIREQRHREQKEKERQEATELKARQARKQGDGQQDGSKWDFNGITKRV